MVTEEKLSVTRELLLALLGHHGNVIIEEKDHGGRRGNFRLHPDFPVHPADRQLIDRVVKLGEHYRALERFSSYGNISNSLNIEDFDEQELLEECDGFYFRTFCRSLDDELDRYRKGVLDVEQLWIQQPELPISYVLQPLDEWEMLFHHLRELVNAVRDSQLRGGELLDLLYDRCISYSGVPSTFEVFKRLQERSRNVLHNQIFEWMCFGRLNDPYQEFFIQKLTGALKDAQYSLWDEYDIRSTMQPSFIPTTLVDKILFVGKAVQLLNNQSNDGMKKIAQLSEVSEFNRKLQSLKSHLPFHAPSFEQAIDSFRVQISSRLWDLIVIDSDLPNKVKLFKDYYLLSNGQLWQAFIETTRVLFSLPPPPTAQNDLNVNIQTAAQQIDLADDADFQLLSLIFSHPTEDIEINDNDKEFKPTPSEMWEAGIGIQIKFPWQLSIIFTKPIIEKYNKTFQFLLKMRKVQLQLQQVGWRSQMQCKKIESKQSTSLRPLWQLRNKMSFIINSLQYYFHVDVVEVQHTKFLQSLQKSNHKNTEGDFEYVRQAHEEYVANIYSLCFLHIPAISRCLNQVLSLCTSYCTRLSKGDTRFAGSQGYEPLANEFDKQVSLLVAMVAGIRTSSASAALAQMIEGWDRSSNKSRFISVAQQQKDYHQS